MVAMQVEFIGPTAHNRARDRLEELLRYGTDQLAIACAFCSAEGARILKRHAARLLMRDSFAVVSLQTPTDRKALMELHAVIADHLYYHAPGAREEEMRVGKSLMHSKVFYARSGQTAWLWTGSHNLTKLATSGSNCEAAVLLKGDFREQPFVDALKHLEACRRESLPFPPPPPPVRPPPPDELAVHVQAENPYLDLVGSLVELRLQHDRYNRYFKLGRPIWVHLHPAGRQGAEGKQITSYNGPILGVNNADSQEVVWKDVSYVVEKSGSGWLLKDRQDCSQATTQTQVLFTVKTNLNETE